LLKLVQDICPGLFEKRSPLLSHLDRIGQVNRARDVWHFAYYFQGRIFTPSWLEVQTESLGQLQLRYSQIVLSRNE
jgi:hypothetical protein